MQNQRDLSEPISLRIPADLLAEIETIAATTERSRSWVIVRALKSYLQAEGRDILAVGAGRREIAQGKMHGAEAVLAGLTASKR